jgi:hypothetical protein
MDQRLADQEAGERDGVGRQLGAAEGGDSVIGDWKAHG